MAEDEGAKVTRGIPFEPGNAAAAGRHVSKRAALVKALFSEEITEQEIRALARKLYNRAMAEPKQGQADVSAAEALLDRMFGKVPQALEHTGPEGGPVVLSWPALTVPGVTT